MGSGYQPPYPAGSPLTPPSPVPQVRVYLTNVEGIARRFVDEKRDYLAGLVEAGRGFRAYWLALPGEEQQSLAVEQAGVVFKGVVKRFFNEKEVTSTLVMDALYCGAKTLEEAGRRYLQVRARRWVGVGVGLGGRERCGGLDEAVGREERSAGAGRVGRAGDHAGQGLYLRRCPQQQQHDQHPAPPAIQPCHAQAWTTDLAGRGMALQAEDEEETAGVLIDAERNAFFFAGDVVSVLERAVADVIPPFATDKPGDALALRNCQGDEYRWVGAVGGWGSAKQAGCVAQPCMQPCL